MIYAGLLLFFVLDYVRPTTFVPALGVLHLNSVVPLAVVAGALVTNRPVGNSQLLADLNMRLVAFLLGLIGISVLTADVTLYAFNTLKMVLGYVLIGVVLTKQLSNMRRIKGVLATMVAVHIMLVLLTPELFTDPEDRHYLASGTFLGDGNDFALSANIVMPLALFLIAETRRFWQRTALGLLVLLLLAAIIMTKSRGGTIALACVGVYYWLQNDRKALTASVGAVVLAVVLFLAPPAYFERMGTISTAQDGSSQGRIAAWTAAIQMALDHPLLGVGAGHFPVKFGAEYRKADLEMPWLTAHSIYFLTLGELGFPGLFALIGFIVSNLVINKRLVNELRQRCGPSGSELRLISCLSASLVAYASGGAFLSAVYYPHMYILAGLLSASRRVVRESSAVTVAAHSTSMPSVQIHPALRPRVSPGIAHSRTQTHVTDNVLLERSARSHRVG